MEAASFISFLIAAVCLTIAPGPDILFVLSKSISSGARAGACVASGLVTGTFIHTALAAFGISLLIRESALAFSILKWFGVAYLCFLGYKTLRRQNDVPQGGEPEATPAAGTRNLYTTGVLMAVLNPKLIIFFLALFPQFIPDDTEHPCLSTLLLGVVFSVQAFVIFLAVALFAGALSNALRRRPNLAKLMNALTAVVLFGIAASVALI